MSWRFILLMNALGCCALAERVRAEVTIDCKPPMIERRTFDPAHPPEDMPPLTGAEAAVTESKFDCQVGMKYQVIGHKRTPEGCIATLAVQSVQATLRLNVIIWLPNKATAKLSAHEEGHRRIAEQVYADAQQVARSIARAIDGKNVSGQADNCDAADKQATDDSAREFCNKYLKRTSNVARQIGDVYDGLTAHGTRREPTEDQAITQAFKKVAGDATPG